MTVEKPVRKCLLRPITPEKSGMNQLQILAIACNLLKNEENSRHSAIVTGWKNCREIIKQST